MLYRSKTNSAIVYLVRILGPHPTDPGSSRGAHNHTHLLFKRAARRISHASATCFASCVWLTVVCLCLCGCPLCGRSVCRFCDGMRPAFCSIPPHSFLSYVLNSVLTVLFAIPAMQWPGSIPCVLFDGVPPREAMAWINPARVCIRGPLEL